MTTQVIFKIDKKIKELAQKKAKSRGMTFSNVLKMATYAYVENVFEPALFPTITTKEQKDIESRYGKKPSKKYVGTVSFNV